MKRKQRFTKEEKKGCHDRDQRRKVSKLAYNAKQKGVKFLLSFKEAYTLVGSACHYCGTPPKPVNTITRLSYAQNYTPGNSVACCYECINSPTHPSKFAQAVKIFENLGLKFPDLDS